MSRAAARPRLFLDSNDLLGGGRPSTRALDQGLSSHRVRTMSGHRDPKTVMRYDHGREKMDLNAVNF